MRIKLLSFFTVLAVIGSTTAQQKYLDRLYNRSTITRTNNIMYADAASVLTGAPKLDTQRMDLYMPTSNADAKKPLIILLHTGSFLPRYVNRTPTGGKDDSATVEFCYQMAERGYIVASMAYRLGWNPAAPAVEDRRSTIINAAYKGVQDLSACIRFFKKNASNYGVDTTKICVGGQGTGGYITYAYASLDKQSEIKIDKFTDFRVNKFMVSDSIWGDRRGFPIAGAANVYSPNDHMAHTSNAQVAFALGGAMGDTSWINAGEIPIIAVHPVQDPFAPFGTGLVYVPGTNPPLQVVEVSGGGDVMKKVDKLGNNSAYKGKVTGDPYTARANQINGGIDGLFPITGLANSSGPWEWWDSTRIRLVLTASGRFTQSEITTINVNGSLSNPLMSKARALKFIDTSLGYVIPRVAVALGIFSNLSNGKIEIGQFVSVSPNPSKGQFTIRNSNSSISLNEAIVRDLTGKELIRKTLNNNGGTIATGTLKGLYFVEIRSNAGATTQKVVLQ